MKLVQKPPIFYSSASIWRIAALILCRINQFINLKIYYYGTLENFSQEQRKYRM